MGAPAASAPEPGPAPGDLQDAPAAMRAAEVQPDEGSARAAARARHHPVQISQSSTATLTKVAQPDGSITAVQYLSPVFHRESGRRVRNDARLAPSSDKVYPLQAQHALHPLHVGHRPDRLLSWDLAAGAVTVTVQGAQPAAADAADSRGRVRFPGALHDSDLLVSSTATGARMDLLLHSAASDRSMTLLVSDPGNALGGVGAATANGGWEFPAVQPGGGHITLDPPTPTTRPAAAALTAQSTRAARG